MLIYVLGSTIWLHTSNRFSVAKIIILCLTRWIFRLILWFFKYCIEINPKSHAEYHAIFPIILMNSLYGVMFLLLLQSQQLHTQFSGVCGRLLSILSHPSFIQSVSPQYWHLEFNMFSIIHSAVRVHSPLKLKLSLSFFLYLFNSIVALPFFVARYLLLHFTRRSTISSLCFSLHRLFASLCPCFFSSSVLYVFLPIVLYHLRYILFKFNTNYHRCDIKSGLPDLTAPRPHIA